MFQKKVCRQNINKRKNLPLDEISAQIHKQSLLASFKTLIKKSRSRKKKKNKKR